MFVIDVEDLGEHVLNEGRSIAIFLLELEGSGCDLFFAWFLQHIRHFGLICYL